MGWVAVIVIIGLVMGGIWYFDKPLFDTMVDTSKETGGQAVNWLKDKAQEKNITTEGIHDKLKYNTTEIDGKIYYGMPYSKVPCQEDSDCDWFERDLKCDTEKGECYK